MTRKNARWSLKEWHSKSNWQRKPGTSGEMERRLSPSGRTGDAGNRQEWNLGESCKKSSKRESDVMVTRAIIEKGFKYLRKIRDEEKGAKELLEEVQDGKQQLDEEVWKDIEDYTLSWEPVKRTSQKSGNWCRVAMRNLEIWSSISMRSLQKFKNWNGVTLSGRSDAGWKKKKRVVKCVCLPRESGTVSWVGHEIFSPACWVEFCFLCMECIIDMVAESVASCTRSRQQPRFP